MKEKEQKAQDKKSLSSDLLNMLKQSLRKEYLIMRIIHVDTNRKESFIYIENRFRYNREVE